jgi:two-component system, cell cycle response regulator
MRFHKAESAFFVFISVVFAAGIVILHAYSLNQGAAEAGATMVEVSRLRSLDRHLFATAVLIATAIIFGLFFIYPLIRTQVREEGKLRAMTRALSQRSDTFQQAALTDALTGMQNRRYFDDALREYLEAFGRIRKPVGLMILDLDHFKQINDTHGHDVGDQVLREVSDCLRGLTRYHDVVARLGGEEFAIVVPNMTTEQLTTFAERLRKAIAGLVIPSGKIRLKVTASFGIAMWNGRESAEEFFRRADSRLYAAKSQGRNRVSA